MNRFSNSAARVILAFRCKLCEETYLTPQQLVTHKKQKHFKELNLVKRLARKEIPRKRKETSEAETEIQVENVPEIQVDSGAASIDDTSNHKNRKNQHAHVKSSQRSLTTMKSRRTRRSALLSKSKKNYYRSKRNSCSIQAKHPYIHREVIHGKVLNTCQFCKKQFSRLDHMKRHINTHIGTKQNAKCSGQKSSSLYAFSDSDTERVQGESSKPVYSSTKAFKKHRNLYGRNKNNVSCLSSPALQLNVKEKDKKTNINVTRSTETNDNYDDNDCSSTSVFKQLPNITRREVNGLLVFVCDICKKEIVGERSAKKHQRIHTGEMSFACSFCPKKFFFARSCSRHQDRHKSQGDQLQIQRQDYENESSEN